MGEDFKSKLQITEKMKNKYINQCTLEEFIEIHRIHRKPWPIAFTHDSLMTYICIKQEGKYHQTWTSNDTNK